MSTLKALFSAVGIAVVMSSCAGTYHAINPQNVTYGYAPISNPKVQLGYHHNVLTENRNKKFARKEQKKNLQLVAIKVTNNTNRNLTFGKDMQVYAGTMPVTAMTQELTYSSLKQQAPLFLLYLLLTPMNLTISEAQSNGRSTVNSYPIGLIVGPGIALGNMLVANGNNKNFKRNLSTYDLTQREIAPGETAYGLIGLTHAYTEPLEMRIITSEPVEAGDDYYQEN